MKLLPQCTDTSLRNILSLVAELTLDTLLIQALLDNTNKIVEETLKGERIDYLLEEHEYLLNLCNNQTQDTIKSVKSLL